MQRNGGPTFKAERKPRTLAGRMKVATLINNEQWFDVAECD